MGQVSEYALDPAPSLATGDNTVLLLTGSRVATGLDQPGKEFLAGLLRAMAQRRDMIQTVILVDSAVTMLAAESAVMEQLLVLEQAGVHVLCSASCLEAYGVQSRVMVGRPCSSYEIVDRLRAAGKVISL
jgi:hypothetical protein